MEPADPTQVRPATERWFIRAGLPHLIRDYDVREDILTRALPVLVLVFLAELAFGGERGGRGGSVIVFLVEVAIVVVVFAIVNRLRGRRVFERPKSVGLVEITIFLVAPPVLRLVFGDDTP